MLDNKLRNTLFGSLVVCLIIYNIYHLLYMSRLVIDPGDDSIIYFIPTGRALLEANSLNEFFATLISSFRWEDHLAPMCYIYGALLQLISSDAEFITTLFAKIIHFTNVCLILFITYRLWKDKSKVLVVFFIITFNLNLCSLVMIRNVAPLSAITGISAFIFLSIFIEKSKLKYFILFCFFYFLTLNSFETSFISIPQLGLYAFLTLYFSDFTTKEKISKMIMITVALIILFIPYLAIHQFIYDFPIPFGRSTEVITISWFLKKCERFYFKMFYGDIKIISGFFGLVLITIPVLIQLLNKYKIKLISKQGLILYITFIAQMICIVLTNRGDYGAQLWSLPGFFLCIVIGDIIWHFYKNVLSSLLDKVIRIKKNKLKLSYFLIYLLVLGLFFFYNPVLNSLLHRSRGWEFNKKGITSNSFNLAINESVNKYSILRKHGALPLDHFEAIWLGNKVYYKKSGLSLYPEALMLNKKNMIVIHHNNKKNIKIDKYMKFFYRAPDRKDVVVIKGPYDFSRLFLNSNNKQLLRVATTGYHGIDSYELLIPGVNKSNFGQQISIKVKFTSDIKKISGVSINNKAVKHWKKVDNNTIKFISSNYKGINTLTFKDHSRDFHIKLIEVDSINKYVGYIDSNVDTKVSKINILAGKANFFVLKGGDDIIHGTLMKKQKLLIKTIIPVFTNSESVSLSSFDMDIIKKAKKRQALLNKADVYKKTIDLNRL